MHKKIKLFTKKSISLILALAVLLTSVISSISVFAAETPYEVSFRAPAIPMDAMTILDLADIKVQLEEDGEYYIGDQLTWSETTNDASKFVLNESEGTITAYQRGTYPLTAQSTDGKEKTIYLSVKQKDETAFPIYEITFDDYSSISNEDYASENYVFTPYPTGWTAQSFANNLYSDAPDLKTLSGISPYNAHYNSKYGANTAGPGIVPFNNKEVPWLAPGFFTLTDSAVSNFYDFTVNSTFVGYDTTSEISYLYSFGTALFGRVKTTDGLITRPIDANNPLTLIYAYKGADTGISDVNLVDYSANGRNASTDMWDLVADGDIDDDGNVETWDYLANKNASMTDTSAQPTVNMSIRYDGTKATLYSPDDTENKEFSYTVADGNGSVGISQSRLAAGDHSYASWVNVRTFGVYLNNAPDDKPAAEDIKNSKVLEDDRVAVFLDTTKSPYVYTDEDGSYLTMSSVDIALGYNPDIIYFVDGIINRLDVVEYTKALEIIGINEDRANTILSMAYPDSIGLYSMPVLKSDLTLKNITIDVPGKCEGMELSSYSATFFYGNGDLVLDDVAVITDADGNGLKLSAVNHEKVTPGSLTIKGNTGPLYQLGFSAFDYWGTGDNYVDGDMEVNLEGGTYNNHVGFPGYETYSSINGNLFLNISGGTFNNTVSMLGGKNEESNNTNAVMKNAVARISGGTFNADTGYGQEGTVYIPGREVIIIDNDMLTDDETLKNGKPLTLTSNATVLIKADSVDYIGAPTYDDNGIITGFAVVQRPGYDSFVNGVADTSIAVTAGGNYTVTYTERAGLLGSAAHADAITNNKDDFVLNDDIAYYEKYQVEFSDDNWVIDSSDDYAYADGVLVPLKTGPITISGTYNSIAFSKTVTVKEFDTTRDNIVNNKKLSIIKDGATYILKVEGKMRYDTLTVNGKPMTYLDEVIDGEIKSGTQYILARITDLTTLSITAEFEDDNADVTGVVYALGATIPTNRDDISLRFVNRAPGIKKTESDIILGSAITKDGVEFTAVGIGALVIPEVLLGSSELKLKKAADYKSGDTVELANGQFAKNVVISVLNDTTAKYSDYSVLLTNMSPAVANIKDLQIALVSYIVYEDAGGNLHIEYTGEISRSYNDVSDAD